MRSLSRKTGLVPGAWRGIGPATALARATAGAQVVVHYGRGANEAEAVVAEIRKAGGRADAVGADLSAPDGAHKLARQVQWVSSGFNLKTSPRDCVSARLAAFREWERYTGERFADLKGIRH